MLDCWQVQFVLKCNKQYKVNCSILQKVIHAGLLASSICFEMQQAILSKLFVSGNMHPGRAGDKPVSKALYLSSEIYRFRE